MRVDDALSDLAQVRMKERRRARQKQLRAEIAANPRVQAIKGGKERRRSVNQLIKQRRKEREAERKDREHERALAEKAKQQAALAALVHPAAPCPGDE